MKDLEERIKEVNEFFPKEERIIIYSINDCEKVHLPNRQIDWNSKTHLYDLLIKYHKTLEILEK